MITENNFSYLDGYWFANLRDFFDPRILFTRIKEKTDDSPESIGFVFVHENGDQETFLYSHIAYENNVKIYVFLPEPRTGIFLKIYD